MTKRHFEALASNLFVRQPARENQDAWDQWENDCWAVSNTCQYFNPRFNREKFLKACGAQE